ncbi:sulfurtransferase [Micropruina sonneratiae]|uniref:sulfurtransferase n=1 Tax=Micropruina sonneratiae TaxID=2986940 RepID=UPI0022263D2C|nr:sulfurtransferase [Micropruina sp. KQZ13P-5]MCW3159160.1 sulfurtransferase [Micropruina sp. KQZ13P-5]
MARDEVLISVEALAGLDSVDLLDVRWRLGEPAAAGRQRYLEGHLPGARFLDLETVLTRHGDPTEGRHPLPDPDTLAEGLGALGVTGEVPIVIYDEAGSFAASRAWWVLRWAGLDVRVLDGGLAAWTAQNRPLASGDAAVEPVALELTVGHLPTIDADEAGDFPGTLLDARAPERYRGETEPIDPVAGHIPGAVNQPVSRFFTADGRLPDDDALAAMLDHPGPLGAYCGSGVSAAQLVLAGAALGCPIALYPGSWSAWSNQGRPVAVGDPRP